MAETIAHCGKCGAQLDESDLERGECAECGWSLKGKKGP